MTMYQAFDYLCVTLYKYMYTEYTNNGNSLIHLEITTRLVGMGSRF